MWSTWHPFGVRVNPFDFRKARRADELRLMRPCKSRSHVVQ
jgi:hypothetical protein